MSAFPIDFDLPPDRIAQFPCEPRDHARLLVLHRSSGALDHRHVLDLPNLLHPGDLLVFNNTRVVPARLLGKRSKTGGRWEGLFLRTLPDETWELIGQTRGRLQEGEWIDVDPGPLRLQLLERLPEGRWRAMPQAPESSDWVALLERHGRIPLPPYIRKGVSGAEDRTRYQTIYAREAGSVAAPTAGLHFTPDLLSRLQERGIERAFVTLHVGLGTFRPIEAADYRQHVMHREWGSLPEETVQAIQRTRAKGHRVVAVGTTTVRVLETAGREELRPWTGETDIYIHPPFPFRVIDALMTNFHLPRSTLLLLVAAFAGTEAIQKAYHEAIEKGYRFFSYGDAMLIQ